MFWASETRAVEVEPSLYAADFARLGEQLDELLTAGVRVFHYDVGDGHFVEPIIIGPIVLDSIAERIHARGGFVDVHLMVEKPASYFEPFRDAGADSVTFHYEAVDDVAATAQAARDHELGVGIALKPASDVDEVAVVAQDAGVDVVLCMSIEPGYSGQEFMPEAFGRLERLRGLLPDGIHVQVDGGIKLENVGRARAAGADLLVAATAVFGAADPAGAYRTLVGAAG